MVGRNSVSTKSKSVRLRYRYHTKYKANLPSGKTITVNPGDKITVSESDADYLLSLKKTYKPCCGAKGFVYPYFEIV